MPTGWRDRLVKVESPATGGGRGWCLEVHDLAASKLAAGREKDLEFVEAMLMHRFTSVKILTERIRNMPTLDTTRREVISKWLASRAPEA